jgi:hypothetical protein
MKVYAAGERQAHGTQTLHIAPPPTCGTRQHARPSWFGEDGEPLQMTVTFVNGEAEVPDDIGRYLTAHKMARKTKPDPARGAGRLSRWARATSRAASTTPTACRADHGGPGGSAPALIDADPAARGPGVDARTAMGWPCYMAGLAPQFAFTAAGAIAPGSTSRCR